MNKRLARPFKHLVLCLAASALSFAGGEAIAGAVIFNSGIVGTSTIALGINDEGHLNITDPFATFFPVNTSVTGLTFIGVGDATSPGCFCEGWGVSGTVGVTAKSGYANISIDGVVNLTVDSFVSDAGAGTGSTATSSVHLTDEAGFKVTQVYSAAPNAPGALFIDTVTITNDTAETITDVRYVRVMDWDIPPTEFSEFVTIAGTATTTLLEKSHDNGFNTANPLTDFGPLIGATLDVDFVDSGPTDHGAYFRFNFGTLLAGESVTFSIFYGAAASEALALAAIAAESLELFSLGQNSIDPTGGTPATFIFGFAGVGGEPVLDIPEPGTLGLLGFGLIALGGMARRRKRA